MQNTFKLCSLFLLVFLISCNNTESTIKQETTIPSSITTPDTLTYVTKNVKIQMPDCEGEAFDCELYNTDYIKITDAGFEYINDHIQSALIDEGDSYEAEGERLLKEYQEAMAEEEEVEGFFAPWNFTNNVEVDFNKAGLFALTFNHYSYMGGAHGMPGISSTIFDLKHGTVLKFYDLVNIADSTVLMEIAEKKFILDNELETNISLNEQGFFWETEGKLYFNDNFTITDKGLMMTYGAYEIAPYAAGMPSFTIPYAELKPYLTKNSPLKRFL